VGGVTGLYLAVLPGTGWRAALNTIIKDTTMDPTACYLSMYEAMKNKDFSEARECALNLRNWLNGGGFYPPRYSEIEVRSYLANVLRRTRFAA
jgi:hypothetical protein